MIEFLRETGSTNADLANRLRAGELLAEGLWLVTDRQTAGRGRQGRNWFDGAGNFMGSTMVRLGQGDPSPETLALVAGLAVHTTVSEFLPSSVTAMLKWPNDVMVDGAKLAGILLERTGDVVVIGAGVNLVVAPALPDRATVCLAELGGDCSRDEFAQCLSRQFAEDLARWRNFGMGPIVNRWLSAGHSPGTALLVHGADGEAISGTFSGLSPAGALQLRLGDGTTRTIHSGEIDFAPR